MADTADTLARDRGPSVDDLAALVEWDDEGHGETVWDDVGHVPYRYVPILDEARHLAWRAEALHKISPRPGYRGGHDLGFLASDLLGTCAGLEREFTFRFGLLVGQWAEQHPNEKRLDDPPTIVRMAGAAARSAEASQWAGFVRHDLERLDEAISATEAAWALSLTGPFGHLTRSDLNAVILKATEALGKQSAREFMVQIRACADK